MNISSRLLAPVAGVQLPVLDTSVGSKRIGVAVIVGDYANDTVASTGNDCIRLLGEFMTAVGMNGGIHKVEITTSETVAARVKMVLAVARAGDAVVFICENVALFDLVTPHLNVRR